MSETDPEEDISAPCILSRILFILAGEATDSAETESAVELLNKFLQQPSAHQELALTLALTSVNDEVLLGLVSLAFQDERAFDAAGHVMILFLLHGMRRSLRIATLEKACRHLLEAALIPRLLASPSEPTLWLLDDILVGSQHSPQLFLVSLPALVTALRTLEGAQGEPDLLKLLQIICSSCLDLWQGYPVLTQPLVAALGDARSQFSHVDLRTHLSEKRWLLPLGAEPNELFDQNNVVSSAWVGGEWDTSCGNMVLHATENASAHNSVGYVHSLPQALLNVRPAATFGAKGLLLCAQQRYYPGTVVDVHRGMCKFRCDSVGGNPWVPPEFILSPQSCPRQGPVPGATQCLARCNYSSYYERGVILEPASSLEVSDSQLARNADSLLVRFDSQRAEWVPREKIYIGSHNVGLVRPPVSRFVCASLNSLVRTTGDGYVMEGTMKPQYYSTRGSYSLTFDHGSPVFSGRWNHGESNCGNWIGSRYDPLTSFSSERFLADPRAAELFQQSSILRFNGEDTIVDLGGHRFFSFAGQQCFTFEATFLCPAIGQQKMTIFHKHDEHGAYISGTGKLCYWRRVHPSASSTISTLVEVLEAPEHGHSDGPHDELGAIRERTLYHLAIQYNGIHAWIILNRKLVACSEMRPIAAPENPSSLLLGGSTYESKPSDDVSPYNPFRGHLILVKVWGSVRPLEKLESISPGLEDPAQPPSADLMGSWPMISHVPLICDLSPYGNHGFVSRPHRGFADWVKLRSFDDFFSTLHPLFHTYSPDLNLLLSGSVSPQSSEEAGRLVVGFPGNSGTPTGSAWSLDPIAIHHGFDLSFLVRLHQSPNAKKEHCFCLQFSDIAPYSPAALPTPGTPSLLFQFLLSGGIYTVKVFSQLPSRPGAECVAQTSGMRFKETSESLQFRVHYTITDELSGHFTLFISDLAVLAFSSSVLISDLQAGFGAFRFGLISGDVAGSSSSHTPIRHDFQKFSLSSWSFLAFTSDSESAVRSAVRPQTQGDLDSFVFQMFEFERAIKPSIQNAEWKFHRQQWYEDSRFVSSPRMAGSLLRRLGRSLSLTDWRRDDRSRWVSQCRRTHTISDLVELLLELELVTSSKMSDWYAEKAEQFRNSLNHLRLNENHRSINSLVQELALLTRRPIRECRLATTRSGGDREKALEWLQNEDNITPLHKEVRRAHIVSSISSEPRWSARVLSARDDVPDHPSRWEGYWYSNRGIVSFSARGQIEGKLVDGSWGYEGAGKIGGFLYRNADGAWRFMGSWRDVGHKLPQPCAFDFDATGTSFTGWSNTDVAVSIWNGRRYDYSVPHAIGLVNTGNSCYQNSLLQALFTTQSLRQELLSGKFHVGGSSTAAWKLIDRIQTVFAKLQFSLRNAVDPEVKCFLQAPYNGNRQHDSFEFGTYLLDTLIEQLRPTPLNGLIERVYGGTQVYVKRCCACSETSTRTEDFTFLSVPFPSNYRPITSIQFVSGKWSSIGAPPGYTRISVNLNEGRKDAPYIYMCCRRDRHELPITDLQLLILEDPTLLPQYLPEGWEAIDFDLNPGAKNHVFLLFRKSPTGSPITELTVITDDTIPDGFKRLDVDLNMDAGGKYVYICLKRTNPIKSIVSIFASSLEKARRRVPAGFDLLEANISFEADTHIYLATTSGGVLPPLTSIEYVHDPDFAQLSLLASRKNLLNSRTDLEFYVNVGFHRYLRCIRGHGSPIKLLDVFRAPTPPPRHGYELIDLSPPSTTVAATSAAAASSPFDQSVLDEIHAAGVSGSFKMENSDHIQISIPHTEAWTPVLLFSGTFSQGGGKLRGFVLQSETSHIFRGTWTNHHWKHPQPFFITFDETWHSFEGLANTGDSRETVSGLKLDTPPSEPASTSQYSQPSPMYASIPRIEAPDNLVYVDLIVVLVDQEVPEGYEVMTWKPVLMFDRAEAAAKGAHVYAKRLPVAECEGSPVITDVAVFWPDLEPVPEGFKALATTHHGSDATFRCGEGEGHKLQLSVQTSAAPGPVARGIYISFTWFDPMPDYYLRQMKTAKLDLKANLSTVETDYIGNRNEHVYLLVWKGGRYSHPIATNWETSLGKLALQVDGKTRGIRVRGCYGPSNANIISGVYLQEPKEIIATYQETINPNTASCGFRFPDDTWMQVLGNYTYAEKHGVWNGWKDIFLSVGLRKDYLCQWRDGEEVFSVAGENNHIDSLFSQAFCPEIMAGSNRITCNRCDTLRDSERYTCISKPPAHLILSLKRFAYDYRSGRMDKLLDKVEFGPTLTLPRVPEHLVSAVFENQADHALQLQNQYGLYAVVVHAGTTLDGGHYYTFARSPTSAHLDAKDDPDEAPWCRYDDDRVTVTDWKSLKDHLWSSIDNSEYLLFYRRIDLPLQAPDLPEPSLPVSTVNQVIKSNVDYLIGSFKHNASLHFLQELETEARLKHEYLDVFDVPYDHLYIPEDPASDVGLLSDQGFSPGASSTSRAAEDDIKPVLCPHCERLMPLSHFQQHLTQETLDDDMVVLSCTHAQRWYQAPSSSSSSEPVVASSSSDPIVDDNSTPLHDDDYFVDSPSLQDDDLIED